eukprot:COSAG01_NODE_13293_length_1605_cov_66.165339_1_plen_67_part_10
MSTVLTIDCISEFGPTMICVSCFRPRSTLSTRAVTRAGRRACQLAARGACGSVERAGQLGGRDRCAH